MAISKGWTRHWKPYSIALAVFAFLASSSISDDERKLPDEERAIGLERVKKAAAEYTISVKNDRDHAKLNLLESPVLRFSDPVSSVPDGALFLWLGDGRPEAAGAIWSNTEGRAWIEFQSLSSGSLDALRSGRSEWHPSRAGLEWKPLPEAPLLETSGGARLVQMRTVVRSFTASISDSKGGRQELRALPQPVFRYSQVDRGIIDGALFVFARSTNPEVLLLIEAREQKPHWQYSPARMTGRDCELRFVNELVWSLPTVGREVDRDRSYLQLNLQLPERE